MRRTQVRVALLAMSALVGSVLVATTPAGADTADATVTAGSSDPISRTPTTYASYASG